MTQRGLYFVSRLVLFFGVLCCIGSGGLDLPVPPVRLGDPPLAAPPTLAPPPRPDDDEDPRDTPPPVFYGEEIDAETDSIVYVIDVSGSMNLDGRLARAQAELIRSVNGLPASFVFGAIAYSDVVYDFGGPVPATPENKNKLAAWVLNFNAHGYTATGPAVANALADKNNLAVVLLTDGFPNYGVALDLHPNTPLHEQLALSTSAHRRVIQNANTQGATIDVFGIAARGPMRAFCQAVAAENGGSYHDIP